MKILRNKNSITTTLTLSIRAHQDIKRIVLSWFYQRNKNQKNKGRIKHKCEIISILIKGKTSSKLKVKKITG